METSGDYLRVIEKLQSELKARESDIQKAATIGKQLLEDRDKLREDIEKICLENESLKQDKYSLKLDWETKVQTVNTQSSELELQREKFDDLIQRYENQQKEITTQRTQISNLKSEKYDLEKSLEEYQESNNMLKKRILSQELQIKGFQQKAELSVNLTVIEDNLSEEADINFYRLQNQQLQEALKEIQYELQSAKLEEMHLTSLVDELREGVQERDKEIRDYSLEIQKARDVHSELQGEIEILKLQQVDVKRRGNSVFGELDDRRLLVEKEYKLLANQHQNVLKNYASNKEELTRCKGQLVIMMSMQSRNYQDAYIRELEDNLGNAKREIESLTFKLNRTIKSQQSNTQKDLSKGDEYNYLRILNEQAEKKYKTLENELMTLHMKNINATEALTTTQRFLYQTQEDLDAVRLENMKLKQEIKDLTVKPDSAEPTKRKPNVEIIPGIVPSPEAAKLLKKTLEADSTEPREDIDIIPGVLLMGENGFRQISAPRRSNRSILREWNTIKDHKESGVEKIDVLREIKNNNEIDYEACKMKPKDKKYEPYVNKKLKDDRCTQQ